MARVSARYAVKEYDFVAILRAKYGLLFPDEKIEPYNLTLNGMNSEEVKKWSEKVFNPIKKCFLKSFSILLRESAQDLSQLKVLLSEMN